MSITSKGKGWELRHSIWIAWALFVFPWISFFYIGIRTKHRRWLVWGAVYSVPFILTMFTGESSDSSGSALSGFLLLIAWIGGHSRIQGAQGVLAATGGQAKRQHRHRCRAQAKDPNGVRLGRPGSGIGPRC